MYVVFSIVCCVLVPRTYSSSSKKTYSLFRIHVSAQLCIQMNEFTTFTVSRVYLSRLFPSDGTCVYLSGRVVRRSGPCCMYARLTESVRV